jgi:CBS domain-containing protein
MNVRELMTPDPEVCLPSDTCATAGKAMQRRRCGCLPVVASRASQRVVGIVTDRDLALALAQSEGPAGTLRVEECMTRDPKTIGPDADLTEAAQLMEQLAVHRVPVVEDERLIGILSLKDIAIAACRRATSAGPNVAERQLVDIIEAIAAAQKPAPVERNR